MLLELAGAHVPVDQWPGQLARQQRVQHAREAAQAAAVEADRPASPPETPAIEDGRDAAGPPWPARARQAAGALHAGRRRRREQATAGRQPSVPPPLGDHARRASLLALPDGPRPGRCRGRPVTPHAAAPAGFVLPGPLCDRETAAAWTRWQLTRHGFTPAPQVTIAEWRAMSPRSRQLHDLHRATTHASLAFQETPMSAAVARLRGRRCVRGPVAGPARPAQPRGHGRHPGPARPRRLVAYAQTPVTATPQSICQAILHRYIPEGNSGHSLILARAS